MKRFFNFFMLFWITSLFNAQNTPLGISCATDISARANNEKNKLTLAGTSCSNTSQYYSSNDYNYTNFNLYLPKLTDDIIYLKLNFIFPTKPDGTGNFEQNNLEHVQAIDDAIADLNNRLLNLQQPSSGCEGYGNNNQTSTKIQFLVNKIWKVDPAWDYLYTGYDTTCPVSQQPCSNFYYTLNPSSPYYYYRYYDNDPTVPKGINIVFANNGNVYNGIINQNYNVPGGQGWAASMESSNTDYNQQLRQFFPDVFNDYLVKKNYVADNPDPQSPYPNTPWSTVRSWFINILGGGVLHETGHNFNLQHTSCNEHFMQQSGTAPRNYVSNRDISKMYLAASTKSMRQYFTEDSFKNTNIGVSSDETWDINFRLYSNVKIDDNSNLKATCKIIMAPQSRFIVKDGSNFIIEGAEITSANNSSWNGIKVEGKGSLLINPNTLIDTKYFYAYADNTLLPGGKMSSGAKELLKENSIVNEDYKIYPNPTGDFINIETTNKISNIEVSNLLGKSFSIKYKNNKVDVRNLPQGNFILKIYSDQGIRTINFIKK